MTNGKENSRALLAVDIVNASVYIVYMPQGRHQHKEVAKALLEAKKAGFLVTELHSGHVWGKVVAPNGQELKVWSTPRSAETMARRIREFMRKYPPERSR